MDDKGVVGATTITKASIEALMETVQDLYLADDIPWIVGYSGGKDSTATLQLVWLALEKLDKSKLHKPVHIIHTNTLVESPIITQWAKLSLEIIDKKSEAMGLPFVTHILTPEVDNTFWVNFLGRGYPFPRKKFRWCTDRLKIRPVNSFIQNRIAEHGEIILVLGTRKAESTNRAKTMAKYEKMRVRELLSPNPTLANELVFSPLENWTDRDVWVFLMQYKNPWGYSNNELLTLYMGASSDTECPMMVQEDLPSCGKSRFGCWVCTMVEKDKSMEAMIANDEDKAWMTPLLEFRNAFGDEEKDRERRSFRRLNGSLQGSYGRLYHGPYKKEIREEWLRKLLEIQREINTEGPEDFADLELISMDELRMIRRIWVNDKHEFEDMVPKIYEDVFGKPFDDPDWVALNNYGKLEWDILQDVCNELYPDEELLVEMVASLIDIENKASGLKLRRDIQNKIMKTVNKCFYKNEEDATSAYLERVKRKQEYGAAYNEVMLMPYDENEEET